MRRYGLWIGIAVVVVVVWFVAFYALAQQGPIDDLGAGVAAVLTDLILTKANVALMAAVWVVIQTARRLLPTPIFESQAWVRAEPVLAIVLCSAGVWIPGLRLVGSSVADTILLGVILGFVVGQTHKIGVQSVLGRDSRLEVPPTPANPTPAADTTGRTP